VPHLERSPQAPTDVSRSKRGGAVADVVVIGGGLIGLASTAALVARRARVALIAERRAGEASPAAAGMLAPGVERATGPAHDFAVAGRDFYPDYVAMVAAETGICVPLNRNGILELVPHDGTAVMRRAEMPSGAEWVPRESLRALEPELADMAGAVLHPDDGAVDNVLLLQALWHLAGMSGDVTVLEERAEAVEVDAARAAVRTSSGQLITCESVVLAPGAWVSQLSGLPRTLPVRPVRG
jgi:glycine oxidase